MSRNFFFWVCVLESKELAIQLFVSTCLFAVWSQEKWGIEVKMVLEKGARKIKLKNEFLFSSLFAIASLT